MGKLKGFYKNNRIYCIMMAISILCIALILGAFAMYFVEQTKTNSYGNRLNGIENVEITDKHKEEIIEGIKENKKVDSASVTVKGRIIYVTVYLSEGKREDAQGIAIKSLDALTEDEKNFYDINFTFAKKTETTTKKADDKETTTTPSDEGFPMMGYKKSDATIISWTRSNGE